ncbi:hypothetical protein DAI43_24885, partial [Achromobacter xylosoxidans]
KLYRLDNGRYPSTAQGLRALVQKPEGVNNWRGYLDPSRPPPITTACR